MCQTLFRILANFVLLLDKDLRRTQYLGMRITPRLSRLSNPKSRPEISYNGRNRKALGLKAYMMRKKEDRGESLGWRRRRVKIESCLQLRIKSS